MSTKHKSVMTVALLFIASWMTSAIAYRVMGYDQLERIVEDRR